MSIDYDNKKWFKEKRHPKFEEMNCKDCGRFWYYWKTQGNPDTDGAVYCPIIDKYVSRTDKVCEDFLK